MSIAEQKFPADENKCQEGIFNQVSEEYIVQPDNKNLNEILFQFYQILSMKFCSNFIKFYNINIITRVTITIEGSSDVRQTYCRQRFSSVI